MLHLRSHRPRRLPLPLFLLIALLLVSQSAVAGGAQAAPSRRAPHLGANTISNSQIKHIIYIVKENRSFDSLFGAYATPQNGVDGATTAVLPNGATVPLGDLPDTTNGLDIDHLRTAPLVVYDAGAMDNNYLVPAGTSAAIQAQSLP